MTNAQMPLQMLQIVLVKDLGNEAQPFINMGGLAVASGDSRGLLSSMLQSINGKIGQAGDVHPGGTDAKDAACFTGRIERKHFCNPLSYRVRSVRENALSEFAQRWASGLCCQVPDSYPL